MRIYLGGDLDFYHPQKERWLTVEIEQSTRLADLLVCSGIPLGEIHLVAINGEHTQLEDAIVSNKDEVKIFSAVGGG